MPEVKLVSGGQRWIMMLSSFHAKWWTDSRKIAFISLYCEPEESQSKAADKLHTNAKQIRRWRESDSEFNERVADVERIAAGISSEEEFRETLQRVKDYIKVFLVRWDKEIGYQMFRRGIEAPDGAPTPPVWRRDS